MRTFILLFCTIATTSSAQTAAVDDWFRFMAETNTGSAMDAAGSRGPQSAAIGAGIQNQTPAQNTRIAKDQLRPTGEIEDSTARLSFVSLQKGTPWPLDLELNAGTIGDGDIQRLGGNVQWTWLQIPKGPAVSSRLSYHTTSGYKSSQIRSAAAKLVGSAGYSYVAGYAMVGLVQHQGTLDLARSEQLRLALRDPNETLEKRTWQEPTGAAGIQIKPGTPFLTTTVEWFYTGTSYRGITAKLTIGL